MYEAGRESVKERPSTLLWVVCYFFNGGTAQAQQKAALSNPLRKEDFTDEQGVFDGKAFMRALQAQVNEVNQAKEYDGLKVRRVHRVLVRFLHQRIMEAQIADAMHLMPGNRPWNAQPAWMWQLWSRYWSGVNDERDRQSRIRWG